MGSLFPAHRQIRYLMVYVEFTNGCQGDTDVFSRDEHYSVVRRQPREFALITTPIPAKPIMVSCCAIHHQQTNVTADTIKPSHTQVDGIYWKTCPTRRAITAIICYPIVIFGVCMLSHPLPCAARHGNPTYHLKACVVVCHHNPTQATADCLRHRCTSYGSEAFRSISVKELHHSEPS